MDPKVPNADPTVAQRVQDLWFPDGNIILQAGNTQFRVYQGILAARSPIFQDMLSLRVVQPQDAELVEGCPLVHLPDSANEVTAFLKAIFDSEFFPSFPGHTTFDVVVGCLRLSHKYDVGYLRRRALVHLSSGFRMTLAEVDAPCSGSWERLPGSATFSIRAIHVAREVGALWLLPHAFFELSNCFAASSRVGRHIFEGLVHEGVLITLSEEDQNCFFDGHDIQSKVLPLTFLAFLSSATTFGSCTDPLGLCDKIRFTIIHRAARGIIQRPACVTGLFGPPSQWDAPLHEDACSACSASIKGKYQDTRETFWEKLPIIYGLPPWAELETIKSDAIGPNLHC
ncbi:hypothetical protein GGX14DRAFT_353760 [Mycena pura]|uniref:BTB domain-containing protein n=1 Tax=Mycena pura TaxID=153505 RepID=A0AAD6VSF8_9AGAR|nr:hypothetical protein GGX14DRAFT_353760 [Mycena pura]